MGPCFWGSPKSEALVAQHGQPPGHTMVLEHPARVPTAARSGVIPMEMPPALSREGICQLLSGTDTNDIISCVKSHVW